MRFESSHDPDAAHSIQQLVEIAGDSMWGILFFGSRLVQSSPDPHSAADLFVIVRDYNPFYRRFVPATSASRSAGALAWLNRWLPPNVLSFRPNPDTAGAKLFVIDRDDFLRASGPRARDHFCLGRMSQTIAVAHAANDEAQRDLEAGIDNARRSTLEWAPLECPPSFDVLTYCERMLSRSYRAEIRPESPGRVREVLAAQEGFWAENYHPILSSSSQLKAEGNRWRLAHAPSWSRRLRWNWYFRMSRVRATLRWLKYVLTFDDWLEYLKRKAERRTGQTIEITPTERRWPLVLLWPKAWRVLRTARQEDSSREMSAK